jgi:hypothetical protein
LNEFVVPFLGAQKPYNCLIARGTVMAIDRVVVSSIPDCVSHGFNSSVRSTQHVDCTRKLGSCQYVLWRVYAFYGDGAFDKCGHCRAFDGLSIRKGRILAHVVHNECLFMNVNECV